MKSFKKRAEYICLSLFVLLLSQVSFFYMGKTIQSGKSFDLRSTIVCFLIYFLVIFYSLRIGKQEKLLSFNFHVFNWRDISKLLLSFLIFIPIVFLTVIIAKIEGAPQITSNQAALNSLFSNVPKVLMFIDSVIKAPVLEEITFRGLIPQKIFPHNQVKGLMVGVVLFGLFHFPTNISSFIFYTGSGAILAWVAYSSKRLEMSILAHALRNFIAFLL